MPPGLKDVAARAGVSIKTVSNVVNGYVHVAPATRARVRAAIEALGYVPNPAARQLRGGRSGVIALAVPELPAPQFAELAGLIVQAAGRRRWTVLIDQTDGRPERERDLLARLRRHAIDGLIFSPVALSAEQVLSAGGPPTVLLGSVSTGETVRGVAHPPDGGSTSVVGGPRLHPPDGGLRPVVGGPRLHSPDGGLRPVVGGPRLVPAVGARAGLGTADHVAIDNVAAGADATRHLCRLGRRRIAVLGVQDAPQAVGARQRLAGYRAALAEAGLTADPRLEAAVTWPNRAEGAAAMARLLDGPARPDAVFCLNDLLALGALRTLLERGVDVPGEVAVMGFDDIEDGRFGTPTLSTVAPDTPRIAQLAVDLLAERLGGGEAAGGPPRELCVRHRLVPRESTLGRRA